MNLSKFIPCAACRAVIAGLLGYILLLSTRCYGAVNGAGQSNLRTSYDSGQSLDYFNMADHLSPEQAALDTFFRHYGNNTQEVDLVFVLDRSKSVRDKEGSGWSSILMFVRNILEHFTVDANNTRVAVITYSTTAAVEFNDLRPRLSDKENKCTMFERFDKLRHRKPAGYTATSSALETAYNILLDSRSSAKKAVVIVTDGRSNIGPPPVRRAVDILSMEWTGVNGHPGHSRWDTEAWGPQVEMFAFGIGNACMPELRSMASPQQNHTFLVPNFEMFEQFARSIHGGSQKERWFPADRDDLCGPNSPCAGPHSHCMCGAHSGIHACVCEPGHGQVGSTCEVCPLGYYKEGFSTEVCRRCPDNTTTSSAGSVSLQQCELLPGHIRCERLPDIEHGSKFYVSGTAHDEVQNTGVPCDGAADGNSCHYECEKGYRLSGNPVLHCDRSGNWVGSVPSCDVTNCHEARISPRDLNGGNLTYLNDSTTYGSVVQATCRDGAVPQGSTYWYCDEYGRWTIPRGFRCIEVFCGIIQPVVVPHGTMVPDTCVSRGRHRLGSRCSVNCQPGFVVRGPANKTCHYDETLGMFWHPKEDTECKDVEPPQIQCPEDLVVSVPHWGASSVVVHYRNQAPLLLSDNSGEVKYTILDAPNDDRFFAGTTQLTYLATDATGNNVTCARIVTVKDKDIVLRFCPSNITINSNRFRMPVSWPDPVFWRQGNVTVDFTCFPPSNTAFYAGEHRVICNPNTGTAESTCAFTVTVLEPECRIPFADTRPPAKGAVVCGEGVHPHVKTCRVGCTQGYAPRVFSQFSCGWDGTWDIGSLTSWPLCYRRLRLPSGRIRQMMSFNFSGDCSDNRANISVAFTLEMTRKLEQEVPSCNQTGFYCNVRNVVVTCGRSRRKRDVGLSMGRRVRRELPTTTPDVISDASTTQNNVLSSTHAQDMEIEFDVVAEPTTETTDSPSQEPAQFLYALEDMYYLIMDGILVVAFPFNGSTVTGHNISLLAHPELELNCSEGEIEGISEAGYKAWCGACPVGSFTSNGTCILCEHGFYQDTDGQASCVTCPSGTNTTYRGARNVTECKEPCEPGNVSASGLAPCNVCPRGTYQPDRGQRHCQPCLAGTSTDAQGSISSDQCRRVCGINSFSSNGLEPCQSCPIGSHQPQEGAASCLPCSGSDRDLASCPENVSCASVNVTCDHGQCMRLDDWVECVCHDGYEGEQCDSSVDDCPSVDCLHNGTCIDGHRSATCACLAAYTGSRCEFEVDECSSQPCHNGGVCVDLERGHMCICHQGFTGPQCEEDIDECSSNPCLHGTCHNALNRFTCTCNPGYTGVTCDKTIDYCANVRCANGGRCVNEGGDYRCVCNRHNTGRFCETLIDTCLSNPCQNNGSCISMDYGFHCACPLGFAGPTCAISVSSRFDIVFTESSVNNYITLRVWSRLFKFSFCGWFRTSDRLNRGTLVSYSVPSNWLSSYTSNAFSLTDYSRLQVQVNGESVDTGYRLNDGTWRHVCVTWNSEGGEWRLYDNMRQVADGIGLASGTHIESGGYLVLGQNQDGLGGAFHVRQAFLGEMSQLFLLNDALQQEEVESMYGERRTDCQTNSPSVLENAVFKWTEVLTGMRGNVRLRNTSMCLDVNACMSQYSLCGTNEYCVDGTGSTPQCLPCTNNRTMCEVACRSDTCRDDLGFCYHGADLEPSNAWSCDCDCSLYGPDIDPCASSPCLNGGQCTSLSPGSPSNFLCSCDAQYTGLYCETLLYDGTQCPDDYCLNGGVCDVDRGIRICICEPQWGGERCQVRHASPCDFTPCLNNGTCVTGDSYGYQCLCPNTLDTNSTAHFGDNCEVLSSCTSEPCLNGGTCLKDESGGHRCLCPEGFSGLQCSINDTLTTTEAPASVTMTTMQRLWLSTATFLTTSSPVTSSRTTETELLTTEQTHHVTSSSSKIDASEIDDPCSNVLCQNGGSCRVHAGGFMCACPTAYVGSYCEISRPTETRGYRVRVTLLFKYTSELASDAVFRHRFRRQVHMVYLGVSEESKLFVHITSIESGSTVVDFRLDHVVYSDTESPGLTSMKRVLLDELREGRLGNFPASTDRFLFETYKESTVDKGMTSWLYVAVGGVASCLAITLLVLTVCYFKRVRNYSPQKMNNEPMLFRNHIENPVFEAHLTDFQAPQLRNITEENVYAEPSECQPYATSKDPRSPSPIPPRRRRFDFNDRNRHFPSKGGKDINKEWASHQDVPLPPKPVDDYVDDRGDLDIEVKVSEEDERGDEEFAERMRSSVAMSAPDAEYLSPSRPEAPPTYQQALMSSAHDRPPPLPSSPPPCMDANPFPPLTRRLQRPSSDAYYFTPLSDEEAAVLLMSRPGRPMCRRPLSLPPPGTAPIELRPTSKPADEAVDERNQNTRST